MSRTFRFRTLALCVTAILVSAATCQSAVIEASFQSIGSRQNLEGTTTGLSTNEPGGVWIVGAGWNWGNPFVTATWDPPGLPTDIASMAEEKTVIGISIASTGGYTKPTSIHYSTDIEFPDSRNHTAGVGYYSVLPARADNQNQFEHFTGLYVDEQYDTLQVMADGALMGSSVSVGTINEGAFYNISYDIDTSTGELSNIVFDGSPVAGLSSTAFTDAATVYAGIAVGNASRAYFNNFVISELTAVPEPHLLPLLLSGGLFVGLLRRWRRR